MKPNIFTVRMLSKTRTSGFSLKFSSLSLNGNFNSLLSLAFLAMLVAFGSCQRKTTTTTSNISRKAKAKEVDYEYFEARGRVKYENGDNRERFVVDIRMQKDSIIWLSLRSGTGIEGARALIQKDSIFFINRLDKQYMMYSFDELDGKVNFPFSLEMLQSIIVGNPVVFEGGTALVDKVDNYKVLSQLLDNLKVQFWVSRTSSKLEKITVEDINSRNELNINYTDFQKVDRTILPFEINSVMSYYDETGVKDANIELKYSKAEMPQEQLKFPFKILPRHKRVYIKFDNDQE
ncbi:MAG: hypothetical protein CMO01_31515 [Thalassobius sp.]|nr:hypothetical protein [Thalassovita sp.]